jgi:signal transduction histidine kinase/DNA-binding NarL/FixJ family response regulator
MNPMNILYLEDREEDAARVRDSLGRHFPAATLQHAKSRPRFLELLSQQHFDVVLSDHEFPGCEGLRAFHTANELRPGIPFLFVSGRADPGRDVRGMQALGVGGLVSKSRLEELGPAIEQAIAAAGRQHAPDPRLAAGYESLVRVVNQLSLARDLPAIMAIVRRAARELTGAQGATFVLRDGEQSWYADEDAIGPLWKGQRFPMNACLSGWVMTHRQPAIVEDIFSDPRIPLSSYETTFVRSVTMVPIRSMDPMGAIGNYWSVKRLPQPWEVRLLQALADTTAVAMENVRVHEALEKRVRERTAELEAFSFAVSHDLRAPLRHVRAYAAILLEDHAEAMNEGMRYNAQRVLAATSRMGDMIDSLMQLHITARTTIARAPVDLADLAREVANELAASATARPVDFVVPRALPASGDAALLRMVLRNLLDNAWKFTANVAAPKVELGVEQRPDGENAYFVRDNGAGFHEEDAHRLFGVFQRLHKPEEFPGTGIGLATVQRIIEKHGGRVWAEGKAGEGATFRFTLGRREE